MTIMRRIICLFVALTLLCSAALAEGSYSFQYPVYAGLVNRTLRVAFERVSASSGGTLLLMDESGSILGQRKVTRSDREGGISISVTADMPASQTLRLYLQQGGQQTLQDEYLLAVDRRIDGVRSVHTQEKKIAITFDSASGLGKLPELLALLDKLDLRCTFFLQGEIIPKHAEWIGEIHRQGHELANHSMYHPNMREIDFGRIHREITRCNELITEITGQPVTLYRPPSGYYSYRDRAIGRALGCEMILWTFDSLDGFAEVSRERVWHVMTTKSEPGAIILMHIYGRHTLSVLEEYVPLMRQQGYEFVTVTDLMTPSGTLDSDGTWHPAGTP